MAYRFIPQLAPPHHDAMTARRRTKYPMVSSKKIRIQNPSVLCAFLIGIANPHFCRHQVLSLDLGACEDPEKEIPRPQPRGPLKSGYSWIEMMRVPAKVTALTGEST